MFKHEDFASMIPDSKLIPERSSPAVLKQHEGGAASAGYANFCYY